MKEIKNNIINNLKTQKLRLFRLAKICRQTDIDW